MSTIIKAIALTKTYQSGSTSHQALRGVDVEIERGEFVAIMGPSGCGKSTLLHLLGGIDKATTGQVHFEAIDMAGLSETQLTQLRRRRIGFVFQKGLLLPMLTARENVCVPLKLDGVAAAECAKRADAALEAVGMAQRANHRPGEMSGGEAQRVAIARAIVTDPAVILADEPTGALDSVNSLRIIELFRSLVRDHNQTLILVTHDPEVAKAADRMIRMRDGTVVETVLFSHADRLTKTAAS
ncbi:MAG: ABC transporter ATP-binding protein [Pirellula sp.]|jgi:putative ABC transport system ATP-binding protein|nr:ABC transporter ATP-binding protein [Pirellula sp.]